MIEEKGVDKVRAIISDLEHSGFSGKESVFILCWAAALGLYASKVTRDEALLRVSTLVDLVYVATKEKEQA